MRIPRVYADTDLSMGAEIRLDPNRSHYLKNVLRLKPGAAFILFDGRAAIDYRATLAFDGKQALATISAVAPVATESPIHTHLVQGLARADHSDWTIQKTTELGVNRITLFNARRTQSPLKASHLDKKLAHWRAVATSACEQCGRAVLPQIEFVDNLGLALSRVEAALRVLLDVDGPPARKVFAQIEQSVAVILGPEGGLEQGEKALASSAEYQGAGLGPRTLRAESAATAALALIQGLHED